MDSIAARRSAAISRALRGAIAPLAQTLRRAHTPPDISTLAVSTFSFDEALHPRDDNGRFASTGAQRIRNGSDGRNDIRAAIVSLNRGFQVEAADGRQIRWGNWLVQKYQYGAGRRQGSAPDRLEHLARAVQTVKLANQGVRDRAGGQRSYLHRFDSGAAAVVFVDSGYGHVRGYIYESKRPDVFITQQKIKS